MARYVMQECACVGSLTSHMVLGTAPEGSHNIVQCEKCAHVKGRPIARVTKRKTTWPYYHEGCGVRFESESHEQKYAAANKLTKE